MFGFRKRKPEVPIATKWTAELARSLFRRKQLGSLYSILFVAHRVERALSLRATGTQLAEVALFGWLGSRPDSPIRQVHAKLRFIERQGGLGQAIGTLFLNEYTTGPGVFVADHATSPLVVEAYLFGGAEAAEPLVEMFKANKSFGNPYMPIWFEVSVGGIDQMNDTDFQEHVLNARFEIRSYYAQQALYMRGACSQDDAFMWPDGG